MMFCVLLIYYNVLWLSFVVDCDAQFTYAANEPMKTASLEVVWNGDSVVDDDYGITRTISSFYYGNREQLA